MGGVLCWLGLHKWLWGKVLPARFCRRCGLLQSWRIPGMGSWTTIGQLTTKLRAFDEGTRDALDDLYLTWKQTGCFPSRFDFLLSFRSSDGIDLQIKG